MIKENRKKTKWLDLLFAAIILIQLLALVFIANQKDGMHIDEYYSYILANSYDADRISNAPDYWNRWLNGSEFQEFLTVEKGEEFAFQTVYGNNEKDAHPPLFYFLLHAVCSLFSGQYSPWFGMGMNIVLIMLAQIALFRLGKKLMGNSIWATVPVAIYGGTQLFVDTALFIRMYALMTLLTVLLAEQHYQLVVSDKKRGSIIGCFVLTFGGVFTQYYFAIVAFYFAAATCVFLMSRKQWKWLIIYGISMLMAVVSVFLVFPAGITQITGSETNNVGAEVASHIMDFSGLGGAILSMCWQSIVGMFNGIRHCLLVAVILAGITVVASVYWRPVSGESDKTNRIQCLCFWVALVVIVSLTVVTITHISSKFTYVRYLYNLFPLVALLCGMAMWIIFGELQLNRRILAGGIILVWMVSTVTIAKNVIYSYEFSEQSANDSKIIEHCLDKPLIVLNNGTTYQPTALIHILLGSPKVYMANYNEMASMDTILEHIDCSQGVVYLVLTDTYWSDGFDGDILMNEIVEKSSILGEYSQFGECAFSKVYTAFCKENL